MSRSLVCKSVSDDYACLAFIITVVSRHGTVYPLGMAEEELSHVSLGSDVCLSLFQLSVSTLIPVADSVLVLQEFCSKFKILSHLRTTKLLPDSSEELRYKLRDFKINFIKY